MKSSSSTLSTKLSKEFYLEYFKVLKNMREQKLFNKTFDGQGNTPPARKRSKSNKRRRAKGLRPKSAPGTKVMNKINKGRRGTVDAEKLTGYQNKKTISKERSEIHKGFL